MDKKKEHVNDKFSDKKINELVTSKILVGNS